MGREIKFRAWDRDMVYFNFDDLYYNTICINHGVYDVPVMQYTGLKDKNGQEIYEGDIVNHGSEHHYTGVIIFEDGCFGTQEFHMDDVVPCEVIGNIYENADLLKKEQNG